MRTSNNNFSILNVCKNSIPRVKEGDLVYIKIQEMAHLILEDTIVFFKYFM